MRKNNRRGFTMAEMLIVVAIIIVLAGVAFIAVQNHQRSLAQSERNTIAKEIYFAAQNHLTMAESQGYLTDSVDSTFYGAEETAADRTAAGIGDVDARASKIYYAVVNGASSFNNIGALDLMLPFGSIDETVRAGGSYIIRYQANPAIVLDVFYCTPSGQPERFNHTIGSGEYSTFLKYTKGLPSSGYVVGWYGGAGTGETGVYLKTPSVEVTNAEKLTVTVKDYNKGDATASIKLIVKKYVEQEDETTPKAAFILNATNRNDRVTLDEKNTDYNEYTIILDDITMHDVQNRGWHFADLNDPALRGDYVEVSGQPFTPGEDIVVVAVSYSNSALTNIAYSNEFTTNSLYADLAVVDEVREKDKETGIESITTPKSTTAFISNIRHLENLDKSLSGWEVDLTNATQVEDLDWSDFVTKIGTASVSVCKRGEINKGTKPGCYFPVSNTTALTYDGNHKAISNIVVDTTEAGSNALTIEAGGVFGTLSTGNVVKNLEIKDAKVTLASGDAGALAGTLSGTTITNVVAHNTSDFETELAKTDEMKITVSTAASGAAGGLIGSVTNCTIQKSAAALIVKSEGGNAGGLIGTAVGGTVSGCYAGGHAIDKMNGTGAGAEVIGVIYDSDKYNVTAGGIAGGLIGDAGAAVISYSYSTCSATGVTVGGLIGTGSGAITSSYCTGKVSGTTQGAFAGACGITADCHYYEIINEFPHATLGYYYLTPVPEAVGSDGTKDGVTALDVNADEYNKFCGASTDWKSAVPYKVQTKLEDYYGGKYNLKTVAQLDTSTPKQVDVIETATTVNNVTTPADFVATHYGDWPAPEIFVVNTKTE